MKKLFNYILALGMATGIFSACVDEINVGNAFLEKAPGVDVNIDTVFSMAEYTSTSCGVPTDSFTAPTPQEI